jgi:hypothetical protein
MLLSTHDTRAPEIILTFIEAVDAAKDAMAKAAALSDELVKC